MTSVILNRRTLLSGGTLLDLGALLAACGQQAANEASASAAPSETASATPSEMTSASASTAASDASSAQLLRARSLPAATPAAQRHLTGSTAELTLTVRHKTFRNLHHLRTDTEKNPMKVYAKHSTRGLNGTTTAPKPETTAKHANSLIAALPNY